MHKDINESIAVAGGVWCIQYVSTGKKEVSKEIKTEGLNAVIRPTIT